MYNKGNKILYVVLAIVSFVSGVVVCFEWMGHDKGQRIYSMLKRPATVEKRVEVEVLRPVVVSDDMTLRLINQEYRDALLVISQANLKLDTYSAKEDEYHRVVIYAYEALKRVEKIAADGGN